jgi:serine/threonine-protein kinase
MIGAKLGSFRIEEVIRDSAWSTVYRATIETTGKPAAVKVISSEFAKQGDAYEALRREAEILQQVRHPNIVRFLAVGRYHGTSYFAMEYIEGQTIAHLLAQRGALPWREAVGLAIPVCDALYYLQKQGVVHGNLAPSNLMVSTKGRVKLLDFRRARELAATAAGGPEPTLGTAATMAPEQIRGTPEVSHQTDLYALGNILYHMLTGEPPFSGDSAIMLMHLHLKQPPPRPSTVVPDLPTTLDDLVVRLMAKKPADRPSNSAAVAKVLTGLRDQPDMPGSGL